MAYNQIPSSSVATISVNDSENLAKVIKPVAKKFIQENGNNFKVEFSPESKQLIIKVIGKSAHSGAPQNGINPVPLMFCLLKEADKIVNFKNNHFKDAISYVSDNFGIEFFGKTLGIDYSDDFMGSLTVALTYVNIKDNELEVYVNLRIPRGKEPEQLKSEIQEKLDNYKKLNNMDFKFALNVGKYMFRDLKGNWINTLLNVFGEVTGKESKPISISGSTTAKQLPNGVSFGPAMPGEVYTGHTDNEYKKIENYLFDVQMFTEMFLRIGNLEKME